jgi:hypothetical protein
MLQSLWDNGVAGGTVVALALGKWISAKAVGLRDRPKHSISARYLPPADLLGFFTMPHFVVEYENQGNVPVTFSDFELLLPRFEEVSADGDYKMHLGAKLYIDKRPTSTVGAIQHLRAVDYRTNAVRLEPGESRSDFFDLSAFLDDADPNEPLPIVALPPQFEPVLTFRDSFGNRYHCDANGAHSGRYEAPMTTAMRAAGIKLSDPNAVVTARRWIRWFGWKHGSVKEPSKPHDPTR